MLMTCACTPSAISEIPITRSLLVAVMLDAVMDEHWFETQGSRAQADAANTAISKKMSRNRLMSNASAIVSALARAVVTREDTASEPTQRCHYVSTCDEPFVENSATMVSLHHSSPETGQCVPSSVDR